MCVYTYINILISINTYCILINIKIPFKINGFMFESLELRKYTLTDKKVP